MSVRERGRGERREREGLYAFSNPRAVAIETHNQICGRYLKINHNNHNHFHDHNTNIENCIIRVLNEFK